MDRSARPWRVLVGLAFAIVVVVALRARGAIASRGLGRFRALLPAWRFFDRATDSPRMLVRFAAVDGELGAWTPIVRAPRHLAIGWLVAPARNLGLAYHAVIEQLVTELDEREDDMADASAGVIETDPAIVGLVSYELATRIARASVPARARFQWKLVVPGDPDAFDYLLSAVMAA